MQLFFAIDPNQLFVDLALESIKKPLWKPLDFDPDLYTREN